MGSLKADRLNASRLHLDWGPIDIRKGFIGLAAAAQQHQRRDACSGVALAFCRRRGIFEQGLGLYPSRLLKRGESQERKSVVQGKSVSVRVDLGGRRIIKKKTKTSNKTKREPN